jgi:hypothetical protein
VDLYLGTWRIDISQKSSLTLYKELKSNLEMSPYIHIVKNRSLRKYLTKLRMSSHMLKVETGRHSSIPLNERKCEFCDRNDIEDEYHFVLICPFYADIRTKYINRFYQKHPSVFKFLLLLNSSSQKVLYSLALFCKYAFKLRLESANSTN